MYRKAALLTIGKYFDSLQGGKILDNGTLISMGESYVSEQLKRELRNNDVNWLMFGNMWDKVLRHCIVHDISTNWIDVSSDFAKCKIRYVISDKLEDMSHESFMVRDATMYLSSFLQIESLISISHGSGLQLLERICKQFKDIPILINAGYLYYGDYECIDESEECYNLLDKLVRYYTNVGFRDINAFIGDCEESRVMILCDENTYRNIRLLRYRDNVGKKSNNTEGGFMDAISKM